MAEGFKSVEISDPAKLKSFIEDTTGAMKEVFEVILTYLSGPNISTNFPDNEQCLVCQRS